MKKVIKKTLIILVILIGTILLDSMQALIFNNISIIGIETKGMKREGILVDTYYCGNGKQDTVLKGFSYSCLYDNYIIIDKSLEIKDFSCDSALELFYENENYSYSYSCIKSDYVIVRYKNGDEESVKDALKYNHIDIGNLDKFNINYIKRKKDGV